MGDTTVHMSGVLTMADLMDDMTSTGKYLSEAD